MTDKQIIEKIEEIIAPYQTEIELECLSLPIAIESILERKEQECERLASILTEIKEIAEKYKNLNFGEQQYCCSDILQKISECEVDNE